MIFLLRTVVLKVLVDMDIRSVPGREYLAGL